MLRHVDNFRDFGGCGVSNGGWVRSGRLYRSGQLDALSDGDRATLGGLAISTIVDLRRPHERRQHPSRLGSGFSGSLFENDIPGPADNPWLTFLREAPELSPEVLARQACRRYLNGPFDPAHVDLFSRCLHVLAGSDGPVLIHCVAGKDRTGMLVALIQRLLGVADAQMRQEFLASNDPEVAAARVERLRSFAHERAGRELSVEAAHATVWLDGEHLDLMFDEIDRRCGGLGAYFTEVLGVDAAQQRAIRDRLVTMSS